MTDEVHAVTCRAISEINEEEVDGRGCRFFVSKFMNPFLAERNDKESILDLKTIFLIRRK